MIKTYTQRNILAREKLHEAAFPAYATCMTLGLMTGPYLKEWRKHAGLTQRQVVDRLELFEDSSLPTTEASLSRIETGKQPWAQPIVEALAHVYGVSVEDLMTRDIFQEKARREAIEKGDKVVDFADFKYLGETDRARLVRLWNAVRDSA